MALLALVATLPWVGDASGTSLVPTNYTATAGEGTAQAGIYDYFDDTYRQLIDEYYGANDWKADLGNGHAYEWVAWRVTNPMLTFQFGEPVTIERVKIDFNRTEGAPLIHLPEKVTIGGTDFALAPNAISDSTKGTVCFEGSWTGTSLTISLTDNDPARWIFVDEIKFEGVSAAVPEPSAFALATLGLLGFAVCGRCRRAAVRNR